MQSLFANGDNERFVLKKLVFVNSAGHCFTEIDIDRHLAVFGQNNKGKTSILNALKLFLLPEENLKDCKNKFAFRDSKGGFYSGGESHRHYFPDDFSFIVLESKNRRGTFCQILYRNRNEQGYGRVLLPQSFDSIRHLFWNTQSSLNDGLGEKAADASLKTVLDTLKRLGGIGLSDKKDIRQKLFYEDEFNPEAGQFCILPFSGGGNEREIKAFRSLFQLAYDIGANEKRTLPDAAAAVLEGEKQRANERLDSDLQDILSEEKVLFDEGEYLKKCKNQQEHWHKLHQLREDTQRQARAAAQGYTDLAAALLQAQQNAGSEMRLLQARKQTLLEAKNAAENQEGRLKEQKNRLDGQYQLLDKQYRQAQETVNRATAVRMRYPDLTMEQIKDTLDAEKRRLQQQSESLQSLETAKRDFETALKRRNQAQTDIQKIENQLAQNRDCLPDFLPDTHSRNVLGSLNAGFNTLSVQPDAEAQRHIRAFAALFTEQNGRLAFLGETMPKTPFQVYNKAQQQELLQQDLNEAKQRYETANREMDSLSAALSGSPDNLAAEQKACQRELAQIEDELKLIMLWDSNQAQCEETHRLKNETAAQLDELTLQHESAAQAADIAKQEFENHVSLMFEIAERHKNHQLLQERLNFCQQQRGSELDELSADLLPEPCEAAEGRLKAVETAFSEWRTLQNERDQVLQHMLKSGVLNNGQFVDLSYKTAFNRDEFDDCYTALQTLYNNLESEWHNFENRRAAHQSDALIRVQELEDAAKQIREFEREINQEFRAHRISDLEEIRVSFRLHPNFEQLLNKLGNIDRVSGSGLDKNFYELIRQFTQAFFDQNSGRSTLDMAGIIQEVGYTCRKKGEEKATATSQSTGTNTMINCLLFSTLLNRLMRKQTALTMPLVLDEMDKLDDVNLPEFVKIAAQYGFAVFGTCPNLTPKVMSAVDNYLSLEYFSAEYPYNARNTILYHGGAERLINENDSDGATA